jgi:FeS assembly SUF system protein
MDEKEAKPTSPVTPSGSGSVPESSVLESELPGPQKIGQKDLPDTQVGPAGPGNSDPAAQQDSAAAENVPVPELEKRVVDVLRTCYDPEIPVNIHELGLIYNVDVQPGGSVNIRMTLTSPMCPVAGSLPPEVEAKVRNVPGVTSSKVEVVWDPPWTPAMMSEAAKLQLNMM